MQEVDLVEFRIVFALTDVKNGLSGLACAKWMCMYALYMLCYVIFREKVVKRSVIGMENTSSTLRIYTDNMIISLI